MFQWCNLHRCTEWIPLHLCSWIQLHSLPEWFVYWCLVLSECLFSILEINECESSPCSNGATCMDNLNQYHCICQPGYNSTNCQNGMRHTKMKSCIQRTYLPGLSKIQPMGGNSGFTLLAQSLLIWITTHGQYIGKSFLRPLMTF